MTKYIKLDGQDQPAAQPASVPENLVGAQDRYELEQAETILGGIRAWQVTSHQKHIAGDFDAGHLARIQAHVLQDIYPIVGETRADTLLIDAQLKLAAEKNNDASWQPSPASATHRTGADGQPITLPPADTVNLRLDKLSESLAQANFLRGLEKPEFVDRFTNVYLEYARTHPFEHGNGPVLVATMGLLAERAGYHVELDRVPNLARETDAVLANGEAGDPRRLRFALGAAITEDQSELGEVSRRITLQVVKPKPPPELVAQNARLELIQASLPLIDRAPGPESDPLRHSLKAVYTGDDSPASLGVIRQAARSQQSPEMAPAAARVEAAATLVDTLRQERQNAPAFQQSIQRLRGGALAPTPSEISR